MKRILMFIAVCLFVQNSILAQNKVVPFESDQWDKTNAKDAEFLGRKSLMGITILKDIEFTNGVIEFDIAVNGERSYPGVTFRMKSEDEYERIYIRPHLSKVFQSVVQYEGTFNGLDSWQLYYGPGKTTSATFPINEWFHVKIEVKDTQAKFYMIDMENPVLFITDLTHGISKGALGVWGPMDGSAYFSNFSYRVNNDLQFPTPPKVDNPLGIISDWEISKPLKLSDFDMEVLPSPEVMKNFNWQKVKSLPSGLVDISRYYGRLGQTPDLIWAKTELNTDKEKTMQLAFGYSDYISIFLNGKLLFIGNSSYMSRDGNFQGIIGYNDYIILPLKKGKNELVISVAEQFGGWGFMFQDVDAIYEKPGMTKKWEIKNQFKYPESAVYDKKRQVIYVSNVTYESGGFVSKVKLNGEIEKLDLISGVLQPTGLCINNDKLYIVGRYALIEYDLETNTISNRYKFPNPVFANDVTGDGLGNFYVSDGAKSVIFKLENGVFCEWLNDKSLRGANGILYDNGKVYIATSNNGSIKSIDASTKAISEFFSFGVATVIDGLVKDENGNFLISDNAGRLFRITPDGKEELLLNTKSRQINIADFEYIPEKKILVIPTFTDNRLMMYEIK
jgi:sugar lactone lactonase YvrE